MILYATFDFFFSENVAKSRPWQNTESSKLFLRSNLAQDSDFLKPYWAMHFDDTFSGKM